MENWNLDCLICVFIFVQNLVNWKNWIERNFIKWDETVTKTVFTLDQTFWYVVWLDQKPEERAEIGPWWWSSGHHVRILLQRYEFESLKSTIVESELRTDHLLLASIEHSIVKPYTSRDVARSTRLLSCKRQNTSFETSQKWRFLTRRWRYCHDSGSPRSSRSSQQFFSSSDSSPTGWTTTTTTTTTTTGNQPRGQFRTTSSGPPNRPSGTFESRSTPDISSSDLQMPRFTTKRSEFTTLTKVIRAATRSSSAFTDCPSGKLPSPLLPD